MYTAGQTCTCTRTKLLTLDHLYAFHQRHIIPTFSHLPDPALPLSPPPACLLSHPCTHVCPPAPIPACPTLWLFIDVGRLTESIFPYLSLSFPIPSYPYPTGAVQTERSPLRAACPMPLPQPASQPLPLLAPCLTGMGIHALMSAPQLRGSKGSRSAEVTPPASSISFR